nr:hypothetical protein [Tanacetum cinerariifolium]
MTDCKHCGKRMIKNHLMDRLLKEVLMFERVIHTVKKDMVIHTEKTGMMRLVVEIEYVGKIADVFDKIPYQFDMCHKFAPFRRKSVQELCVHLKLFQFYVVNVHIIKEQ